MTAQKYEIHAGFEDTTGLDVIKQTKLPFNVNNPNCINQSV
jgi:hypothetical protein